ncbi:9214_t:CDS:1 [Dentiscutata heterogama]|uniref:9214_t:CDS:1 n=1 Tax=Dentiscutata heterogama TaxID=1316150 RepID=A0ACA9PJU7_9GLOM|nr:9214_t:CDS:1 [Dentiscutata heterogama]
MSSNILAFMFLLLLISSPILGQAPTARGKATTTTATRTRFRAAGTTPTGGPNAAKGRPTDDASP